MADSFVGAYFSCMSVGYAPLESEAACGHWTAKWRCRCKVLFVTAFLLIFLRFLLLAPVLPNRGCTTPPKHQQNMSAEDQQESCAATRHIVFIAPKTGACGDLNFPLVATNGWFIAWPAVGVKPAMQADCWFMSAATVRNTCIMRAR